MEDQSFPKLGGETVIGELPATGLCGLQATATLPAQNSPLRRDALRPLLQQFLAYAVAVRDRAGDHLPVLCHVDITLATRNQESALAGEVFVPFHYFLVA